MKAKRIRYELVETIPEMLEQGTIYVSPKYKTAIHMCCCGCGEEVVTPFSKTAWRYTINSNQITLYPSIGNWSYSCRSHYWIRSGTVVWAGEMDESTIQDGRRFRAGNIERYYSQSSPRKGFSLWSWLKTIWRRLFD